MLWAAARSAVNISKYASTYRGHAPAPSGVAGSGSALEAVIRYDLFEMLCRRLEADHKADADDGDH